MNSQATAGLFISIAPNTQPILGGIIQHSVHIGCFVQSVLVQIPPHLAEIQLFSKQGCFTITWWSLHSSIHSTWTRYKYRLLWELYMANPTQSPLGIIYASSHFKMSTGERPFLDILQDRRWLIHSITIPSLFLAGVIFIDSPFVYKLFGQRSFNEYFYNHNTLRHLSLINDRFSGLNEISDIWIDRAHSWWFHSKPFLDQ